MLCQKKTKSKIKLMYDILENTTLPHFHRFRLHGSDPTQKNYQRRRELSIGHIFSLLRPLAPENTLKNRKVKIQKKSRSCHIPSKPPAPKISEMCALKLFSCLLFVVVAALAEKTQTGFAGKQTRGAE